MSRSLDTIPGQRRDLIVPTIMVTRGQGVRKMKFVENTPEALLLDIGRVLNEAGVTKEEALRALERARREIYG